MGVNPIEYFSFTLKTARQNLGAAKPGHFNVLWGFHFFCLVWYFFVDFVATLIL